MPLSQAQSDALLLEFVRGVMPLHDLAQAAGITLLQLLDWAETPEIAAALDRLEALAHRHSRLAAAVATAPAINLLDRLVEAAATEEAAPPAEDPKLATQRRQARELGRRAATSIIAVGKPPRPKKPTPETPPEAPPKTSSAPDAFSHNPATTLSPEHLLAHAHPNRPTAALDAAAGQPASVHCPPGAHLNGFEIPQSPLDP